MVHPTVVITKNDNGGLVKMSNLDIWTKYKIKITYKNGEK